MTFSHEKVCLLYHEFRVNLKIMIDKTCYQRRGFPLSLPVVFLKLIFSHDGSQGLNKVSILDLCNTIKLFGIRRCQIPNYTFFNKLLLLKEIYPLLRHNHHALVDVQQLSRIVKLFLNLYIHPDKWVHWQGSVMGMRICACS